MLVFKICSVSILLVPVRNTVLKVKLNLKNVQR